MRIVQRAAELARHAAAKLAASLRNADPLCLLILLFALVIRLTYFIGASHEDDLGFAGLGQIVGLKHDWPHHHQSIRLLNYLPIALLYWITGGITAWTTHFYHMASAIVCLITVYLITRRAFGRTVALIAEFYLAIIPLHILWSSRLMPSMPEAAWGGLGIMLLYFTESRPEQERRSRNYFFVGVLVGCAYLVRETGIALLAAPLGYLFLRYTLSKITWDRMAGLMFLIMGGFLAVFFFEGLAYYVHTGDWALKWKMAYEGQNNPKEHFQAGWGFYFMRLIDLQTFKLIFDSDNFEFKMSLFSGYFSLLGLTAVFIPFALPCFIVKKWREPVIIVAFWFLAYFLFLTFGSGSLTTYNPIRKFDRYSILYLTPMAIIAGWFFAYLWSKRTAGRIAALVLGALALISAYDSTVKNYRRYAAYKPVVDSLDRMLLANSLNQTVYLNQWYCAVLDYRHGYNAPFDCQSMQNVGQAKAGSYLVIRRNETVGVFETNDLPAPFGDKFKEPPPNWVKVDQFEARDLPWDKNYAVSVQLYRVN